MRKPKLRELGEAIKAVIVGPYTSKFPAQMPEVPERYRGKPQYDEKECVGCGACALVCPAKAITMTDSAETKLRRMVCRYDVCIFCGTCQANCITEKGITLSHEFELSALTRDGMQEEVEKELLICEACDEIIGAVDHVRWVARKLGPLAFGNPLLMLTTLRSLGSAAEMPRIDKDQVPLKRGDRIRILCLKCRQETALVI